MLFEILIQRRLNLFFDNKLSKRLFSSRPNAPFKSFRNNFSWHSNCRTTCMWFWVCAKFSTWNFPTLNGHFFTFSIISILSNLPNIGGVQCTPLLWNRQYLPEEKAFGNRSPLLFISTYLTHYGQISWLYHYNFWNYDRFSKDSCHKWRFYGQNTVQVANTWNSCKMWTT